MHQFDMLLDRSDRSDGIDRFDRLSIPIVVIIILVLVVCEVRVMGPSLMAVRIMSLTPWPRLPPLSSRRLAAQPSRTGAGRVMYYYGTVKVT